VSTARRTTLGAIAVGLASLAIASAAQAAGPIQLVLGQSAAFSILGHSCGGIQEESFVTGFASTGYPEGDVHLSTRCGGSGRGGGYKTITYTGSAGVVWDWFGEVRSFARLEGGGGGSPTFEATDAHGDRIYNSATRAYLETGEPPLQAPGAPSGVEAALVSREVEEEGPLVLSFSVSWTPAGETAALIGSSTITATPMGGSGAPVLQTTVDGAGSNGSVGPLARHTSYRITVTSTDAEGTSQESAPIEASSSTSPPPPPPATAYETCRRNEGTIKLSPGLTETPHVQSITIKGTLGECEGAAPVEESASYVDHLKTTEEVTCSTLSSLSAEPVTEGVSLTVRWAPKSAGVSHGVLLFPLNEAGGGTLAGTFQQGPFVALEPISGGEVFESFTGGSTCGLAEGKKKAKAVKRGVFSGTPLEIGEATSE
jgi:hypothetical protein